jgi:hypothetical protein
MCTLFMHTCRRYLDFILTPNEMEIQTPIWESCQCQREVLLRTQLQISKYFVSQCNAVGPAVSLEAEIRSNRSSLGGGVSPAPGLFLPNSA